MIHDPILFTITTSLITAQLMLGALILFHDGRSATNRIFTLVTLAFAFWGAANFFAQQVLSRSDPSATLYWIRLIMLGATLQSSTFFLFVKTFPSKTLTISPRSLWVTITATALVSALSLSPYLFLGIYPGTIDTPIPGAGIPIFIIYTIGFVGSGTVLLVRKYLRAEGEAKQSLKLILMGFIIMFSLIIFFNFFAVVFFKTTAFSPYGPAFTLPFIALTTYAIVRHKLFNLKLIATEALVLLILFVLIVEACFSNSLQEALLRALFLVVVASGGVALIRSVLVEVRHREMAEKINTELKELDEAKSEFVSVASHQLRTPLTAIIGYLSMMKEGDFGAVNEKLSPPIDRVFLSSRRLMNLVETLLDISRIEAGRFEISPEEIDILPMTKRLIEDFQIQARDKELHLTLTTPDHLPKIWADPLKTEDVVTNLIDNALKYTEKGSVTVTLASIPGFVECRVTDTGIGIDPKEAAQIFKRYTRGDRAAVHHAGGLGMGLYIGERIVTAHGGKIWAESEGKDRGSSFCFTLPIATAQQTADITTRP